MKELYDILGAMAAQKAKVPDPRELLLDMSERVVKAVSAAFSCKADEVAILLLTSDNTHLRFVSPRKFSELGTIPVTKRDSIAVNVLGKKQGEAINNVPLVKHVSFFESIKLRDKPVSHPEDDHRAHPLEGDAGGSRADQPQGGHPGRGRSRFHFRRTCARPRRSSRASLPTWPRRGPISSRAASGRRPSATPCPGG